MTLAPVEGLLGLALPHPAICTDTNPKPKTTIKERMLRIVATLQANRLRCKLQFMGLRGSRKSIPLANQVVLLTTWTTYVLQERVRNTLQL